MLEDLTLNMTMSLCRLRVKLFGSLHPGHLRVERIERTVRPRFVTHPGNENSELIHVDSIQVARSATTTVS